MRKKLLAAFLAFAMALALLPGTALAAKTKTTITGLGFKADAKDAAAAIAKLGLTAKDVKANTMYFKLGGLVSGTKYTVDVTMVSDNRSSKTETPKLVYTTTYNTTYATTADSAVLYFTSKDFDSGRYTVSVSESGSSTPVTKELILWNVSFEVENGTVKGLKKGEFYDVLAVGDKNGVTETISSLAPEVTPDTGYTSSTWVKSNITTSTRYYVIYKMTCTGSSHGTVTTKPDLSDAKVGDKVVITSKPNSGYISTAPTVKNEDGKTVAVTRNDDGTWSFTMPEGSVTVTGNFVTPGQMFSDVTNNSWSQDAIAYAVENNLMVGTGTGSTFEPNTATTRGMLVTILYRLEGEPAASNGSAFTDVASGQWYTKAVAWAYANGVVSGYDNGAFGPNDPITREQFATILYNYAKYKKMDTSASANLAGYTDVSAISGWAVSAMKWANAAGLITGVTDTTLVPGKNATRVEAAIILTRLCEKTEK